MPRPKNINQGFALVISLVLMGFLVILLLSLTTMVSIDLQSATHSRKLAQAKQNALLALNVAIGELQRATGPDQRVTSLASLEYGDDAISPYWVGAYAHALTPEYDLRPEVIASEWTDETITDEKGSAAKLLTWLVSGNDPDEAWPAFLPSGQLAQAQLNRDLRFLPNAGINNLTADSEPTDRDIEIQNVDGEFKPARIMVGSGVVENVEDFVVAPLVEMDEGESQGLINSFAWWVGDENVKARANLPEESDPEHAAESFVSANRTAIELMARDDEVQELDAETISDLYSYEGDVARAMSLEDLIMLSPEQSEYADVQKRRYHDISLSSTSLLTDSFAGGLKRDLSSLLDEGYNASSGDPTENPRRLWTPHADDDTGYGIPTWGHLRSFMDKRVTAGRVDVKLPTFDQSGTPDDVGVTPVLTYFSLGFGFSADGFTSGSEIDMNLYPMVVLWNPYNFTLQAPAVDATGANFEVGLLLGQTAVVGIDVLDPGSITVGEGEDATTEEYIWRNIGNIDLRKQIEQSADDPNNNDTEFIRFGLRCPDIPPGQSLIFSLPYDKRGESYENYPVLENIEPEADSFISVTVATLDKDFAGGTFFRAGPRFSLSYLGTPITNLSQTLLDGGDGGLFTYLGEPRLDRLAVDLNGGPMELNPANPSLDWYQTQQSITWDNAIVQNMPDEPILVEVTSGGKKEGRVFKPGEIDSDGVISAIQAPRPLSAEPTISYVIMAHALFSGAGNNAQYNMNQYMFPTRWVAQGNMRAPRAGRTRRDNNFLPLFIATAGSLGDSSAWQKFAIDEGDSHRASAGSGHDWSPDGPVDAVLFEFLPDDQPLMSIGQLQHANLSLIGAYPSYPIGNSLADYRLHEKSTTGSILDPSEYALARTDSVNSIRHLKEDQKAYYDISYLLNRNLWDAYFVSTIPQEGELPDRLPNARMQPTSDAERLRDPDTAASELSLLGGFNINSTSEQAWRAVLGGVHGLKYNPQTGQFGANPGPESPFSRFSRPTSDSTWDEAWQGYRSLTEKEIAQLAHNIVIEIKNRGPFVSLGDFINRRLVDNEETNGAGVSGAPYEYEDLRGVIQAAIDRTWSSSDPASQGDFDTAFPVNDGDDDFWQQDDLLGHPDYRTSSQFKSNSNYAYDLRRISGGDEERRSYSNRSAFSPKYLTQADVLSTIGAGLTARSDTFTIRAYGEVASAYSPGKTVGVWCEAVVQRTIHYVDDASDEPEDTPSSEVNQHFGRRYKLISFQWLQNDEI